MTHLKLFQQTGMGSMTKAMLILILFFLQSCTVYQTADTSLAGLRGTEQVRDNMHLYRFIVHDGYSTYQLISPAFTAEGDLSGKLVATSYEAPDSTWTKKQRKAYWKEHKRDINIFTETVLADLQVSLGSITGTGQHDVIITGAMISGMTMTSTVHKVHSSVAGMIVLGILPLSVMVVLVVPLRIT